MYTIRWVGPGFYARNAIGIYEIQEPGWCDPNTPARWFDYYDDYAAIEELIENG